MENDAASLTAQTRSTFACLHGLIRAVEKEAGKLSRTVALITSAIVLCLGRFAVGGQ